MMTAPEQSRVCGNCCTKLVNLTVAGPGGPILENINIHIHCGELTAIIGPNGAGKTTLFRAMLGEVAYSGTIRFVHSGTENRFASPRIGYVPQRLDLDRGSPLTVLDLFASCISRRPVWLPQKRTVRADTLAGLEHVQATHLIDRRLGQLSGGELQRVLLALALTPSPDLLLLDEPISGVDLAGMELFYQMVSELRRTYDLSVLLVSHDLTSVGHVADRMVVLKDGTIQADGPPETILAGALVRETFGYDFGAHTHSFKFKELERANLAACCTGGKDGTP